MDKLTGFEDTSDVSDAAIEWVCKNLGYAADVWTPENVRIDASSERGREDKTIILAARLIQQHRPDLLVDPVDAIVREELAKANDEAGYTMIANCYRSGRNDDPEAFAAAKRLYLRGVEAGKKS